MNLIINQGRDGLFLGAYFVFNSRRSYSLGGENRSNEDGLNLETVRPTHVDTTHRNLISNR